MLVNKRLRNQWERVFDPVGFTGSTREAIVLCFVVAKSMRKTVNYRGDSQIARMKSQENMISHICLSCGNALARNAKGEALSVEELKRGGLEALRPHALDNGHLVQAYLMGEHGNGQPQDVATCFAHTLCNNRVDKVNEGVIGRKLDAALPRLRAPTHAEATRLSQLLASQGMIKEKALEPHFLRALLVLI